MTVRADIADELDVERVFDETIAAFGAANVVAHATQRGDTAVLNREDFRVIQMTPPGSAAAVIFGTGVTSAAPGSVDSAILVVEDIAAARAELAGRGVDVSDVFHDEGGVFHHAGTTARPAGPGYSASLSARQQGSTQDEADADLYMKEVHGVVAEHHDDAAA